MILRDILSVKGNLVYTIVPEATLADVVQKLVEHKVGSLVVCRGQALEAEQMVGIISERDILHCCARDPCELARTRVEQAMSSPVIAGTPEDAVEAVMGLMTAKRIRHLPVVWEGRLAGMVSIGDIVKAQHDHLAMENRFMKDYIRG